MNDLERARREAAELMGLDPDRLTPADRLRCELIAALRAAVDDALAQVTSANATDLGRLIVAVEALTKFLRESPAPETESGLPEERDPTYDWSKDPDSPRYKVWDYLKRSVEAAREDERWRISKEIEQLNARITELASENEDLHAALAKPVNARHVALPPPSTAPQAKSGAETEAQRQRVNADRSIEFRIMNERPIFRGMPEPSRGNEPWRGHTWRYE